jgi:hypothetical protein
MKKLPMTCETTKERRRQFFHEYNELHSRVMIDITKALMLSEECFGKNNIQPDKKP